MDNQRVRDCLLWAIGRLGLYGEELYRTLEPIKHLHDHKGTLYVAVEPNHSPVFVHALKEAWEHWGAELRENVEVVLFESDDWRSVWNSRRF